MHLIDLIVGARPNFMKAAPLLRAVENHPSLAIRLVHTGQHYDAEMNDAFFRDLGMRAPDIALEVGSASHAEQVARIMMAYEKVVTEKRPAATLVVGDVNSTIATALVSAKLHIPVVHLEAGLRSGDRKMPEEINRLATDAISDLLLTPSRDGDENLLREGVPKERIVFVGNIMIDTLRYQLSAAGALPILDDVGLRVNGKVNPYVLVTLHRPSNVDDPAALAALVGHLKSLAANHPILFPVHPRTRARLTEGGLLGLFTHLDPAAPRAALPPGLYSLPPLPYNMFLRVMSQATLVLTDSGGLQEETTALGIACLTLRPNTERPVTVTEGTNTVVGSDFERMHNLAAEALAGRAKRGRIPEGWDGNTASRVLAALADFLA